ncbi:MAG TPA: Asp-tRNA(Asn)/Glu-tRNA(Gln) amidotransferase subunit GatC [Pirellulales bacterium]|nr:Asp-tRNA(Asn)/Glu-tRNA(Gln) amidotransferase subunit GatC [Pirellulales bacterium]
MSLSRAEVEKVALLARLELAPDELDAMTRQLQAIVGYVEQLSELDTAGIEPMAHPHDFTNVFRADRVEPSYDRQQMLANAPNTDGQTYLVPAVLG